MRVATTFGTKPIAEDYLAGFRSIMERLDLEAIDRVVEHLRAARDRGSTIYLAGNGGSSATASHWANDLAKSTKRSGRRFLRVLCLSDNTPWLTALANDEGYDRAFAGQIENFAQPGDVLIVLSASGNSRNVIRAVELANDRELVTIAFLGFDGGRLKRMVHEAVWVETAIGEYGLVETSHMLVADIVTTCLIRDRAP
jgi:D-sedoheptulose 7-phosphate isomerase